MFKKPRKVSKKPLVPQDFVRQEQPPDPNHVETIPLSTSLKHNLEQVRGVLGDNSDVVIRRFKVRSLGLDAAVLYVDGLVDFTHVLQGVFRTLMLGKWGPAEMGGEGKELPLLGEAALQWVQDSLIAIGEVARIRTVDQVVATMLTANTVVLLDTCPVGLNLNIRGFATRGVDEPVTETLIRGPREGFVENIRFNTALLRRKLRDPGLKLVGLKLGARSKTDCALVYVQDIVHPDLLAEVQKRLATIDIDSVPESGIIEQLIEDSIFSPFPQVQYTERPDKVIAAVLEGRVALLVDGTPFALIMPATFPQFFQSGEDYYERWLIASFTRILRIGASYVATFAPALYVAIISYHPGILPTELALAIAATRQGVPFPAVVEALMMEIAFELLREAGARLPQPIGQTVGIVGGLIVGDAAVRAGLVSPIMIIVVAMTAIASFSIPSYNLAIGFRLLRFPLLFAAAVLGFFGLAIGFIIINVHMVSLKSFGAVYLSPMVPYRTPDWKDLFWRAPYRLMQRRPVSTKACDPVRLNPNKEKGW